MQRVGHRAGAKGPGARTGAPEVAPSRMLRSVGEPVGCRPYRQPRRRDGRVLQPQREASSESKSNCGGSAAVAPPTGPNAPLLPTTPTRMRDGHERGRPAGGACRGRRGLDGDDRHDRDGDEAEDDVLRPDGEMGPLQCEPGGRAGHVGYERTARKAKYANLFTPPAAAARRNQLGTWRGRRSCPACGGGSSRLDSGVTWLSNRGKL